MDARTPPLVRLRRPGELAAALPQLIGFRPQESLIAIGLHGDRGRRAAGRVGLTARVDLPPPAVRRAVVSHLVGAMLTDRPGSVVLAVVSEAADVVDQPPGPGAVGRAPVPGLPHRSLVREALLGFTDVAVPVKEALLVRGGRWWSYDCARECCLPGAGSPLPEGTSPLAAAAALAGQVVERDRAALQRRIAPVGFLAAAPVARASDEVGAELATRVERCGRAVVAEESWALLQEAARRVAPGTVGSLTDREVARLAWGLLDVGVRDQALGLAAGSAPAAEVLWIELTRRAPAPLDAAPATLLAATAWLQGDGAMANVALDRALTSRPDYPMAQLLRRALDACLPPREVRRLIGQGIGTPRAVG